MKIILFLLGSGVHKILDFISSLAKLFCPTELGCLNRHRNSLPGNCRYRVL